MNQSRFLNWIAAFYFIDMKKKVFDLTLIGDTNTITELGPIDEHGFVSIVWTINGIRHGRGVHTDFLLRAVWHYFNLHLDDNSRDKLIQELNEIGIRHARPNL